MDDRLKELIAIGAATTANCVPCLKFHYEKASKLGVTVEEAKEAIEVGRLVRRGAARTWDKEADRLVNDVQEPDR